MRETATGLRWLGWVSLPLVGAFGMLAGWLLRRGDHGLPWRVRQAAGFLLPDLSSGHADYASPWPELLAIGAAGTAVLTLATLGNLSLRAIGERQPGRRFLALWAASAAAAALTGGVLAWGELVALAELDRVSRSTLFTAVAGVGLRALGWALVWGLLGAAVTARLAPVRPDAADGRLPGRIAVAAALLLATTVSAATLGGLAHAAASSGRVEMSLPRVSTSSPAPTPSAEPSDPALLTNPDPDPAFRGRCSAAAIEISYRFADAAAGSRYGLLTARNTGEKPCTLKGYPDLAFADVEGNNVRVKYEHGRWNGSKAKTRKVVLEPGGSARAELTWRGDAGAYDRKVDTILAAPWAGAKRTGCVDFFDVKNGSVLRVSPWLPTV